MDYYSSGAQIHITLSKLQQYYETQTPTCCGPYSHTTDAVLYNCALPGDGPIRPETCKSSCFTIFT